MNYLRLLGLMFFMIVGQLSFRPTYLDKSKRSTWLKYRPKNVTPKANQLSRGAGTIFRRFADQRTLHSAATGLRPAT